MRIFQSIGNLTYLSIGEPFPIVDALIVLLQAELFEEGVTRLIHEESRHGPAAYQLTLESSQSVQLPSDQDDQGHVAN